MNAAITAFFALGIEFARQFIGQEHWWCKASLAMREQLDKLLDGAAAFSDELANATLEAARAYAKTPTGYEDDADPAGVIARERLTMLLAAPQFLSSAQAPEIAKALTDLSQWAPWHFEMYAEYSKDRGYYLKSGIGRETIPVIRKILMATNDGTTQNKRVLWGALAQVLSLLAKEQSLVIETAEARIEMMRKNGPSWKEGHHHAPLCRASFRSNEVEKICLVAQSDSKARALLDTIWENPWMISQPHWC